MDDKNLCVYAWMVTLQKHIKNTYQIATKGKKATVYTKN